MDSNKSSDTPNQPPKEKQIIFKPGQSGYDGATFLEKLTFSWVRPFFSRANRIEEEKSEENILFEELGEPAKDDNFENEVASFNANYKYFSDRTDALFYTSLWTFKYDILMSSVLEVVCSMVYFASPYLTNQMTQFITVKPAEGESALTYTAYWIVIMTCIQDVVSSVIQMHQSEYTQSKQAKASVVLQIMVYEKINTVSFAANSKELNESALTKLTYYDSRAVVDVMNQVERTISKICSAIGVSYFFITEFGWSFPLGLALMGTFKYVDQLVRNKEREAYEEIGKEENNEQDLQYEFLNSIKLLKLYGWEQQFEKRIIDSRMKSQKLHFKQLYQSQIVSNTLSLVESILPNLFFSIYIALGNKTQLQIILMAENYFQKLQSLLSDIPSIWNDYLNLKKKFDRVDKFLKLANVQTGLTSEQTDKDIAVQINGDFSWGLSKRGEGEIDEEKSIQEYLDLKNLNFQAKKGQLICVIGDVGSGKTSLLRAILGELIYIDPKHIANSGEDERDQKYYDELQKTISNEKITESPIKKQGSVSYVEQEAWIESNTIRDIILFNLPYDDERYKKTIKSCQLQSDLKTFVAGDLTEIGESGINLSGGQKARISLARAVYANKDIMLMDDPISALDAEVKKKIFQEVFKGVCKEKTQILATHAVDFLEHCDAIAIMHKGQIVAFGTFQELHKNDYFQQIMKIHHQQHSLKANQQVNDHAMPKRSSTYRPQDRSQQIHDLNDLSAQTLKRQITKKAPLSQKSLSEDVLMPKPKVTAQRFKKQKTLAELNRVTSLQQGILPIQKADEKLNDSDGPQETGILTSDDQNKGQLIEKVDAIKELKADWTILPEIIKYTGGIPALVFKIVATIFSFFLNRKFNRISQDQSMQTSEQQRDQFWTNLGTTFALSFVSGVTSSIQEIWNHNQSIKTENSLFQDMMEKLAKAPVILYFDKTTAFRILGKFNGLQQITQFSIVDLFQNLLWNLINLGTDLYLVFNFQPYLLILVFGFTYKSYMTKQKYAHWGQISRLESAIQEPLNTIEHSLLFGVSVIRAFGQQDQYAKKFRVLTQQSIMIRRIRESMQNWSQFKKIPYSQFKSTLVYLGCMSARGTGDIVNLMRLSNVLQHMDGNLNRLTYTKKQFENSLIRFQRVLNSLDIPQEKQEGTLTVEESWPEKGEIVFKNVSLRYQPDSKLTLKNLSFIINGGSKVGVVGRTGSGKSTTALALPRIIELADGSIEIDGKDIAKISMSQLRSKVTFILQKPTLFKGTLKFNLDPQDIYSDETLKQVIHESGLENLLHKQSKEQNWLKYEVENGGGNLSAGEKQLICICRAILRRSKIIIMDEATANIDVITEERQMAVMNKAFAGCTVVTIAHRINTIINSDQIIMLQEGELLENGNPTTLCSNENSHFSKLRKDLEQV